MRQHLLQYILKGTITHFLVSFLEKEVQLVSKSETSPCCNCFTLHLPSTIRIFKSNCSVFKVSEALSLALREQKSCVKHVSVRQLSTWIMHAWLFGDILLVVISELMLPSRCIIIAKVVKRVMY